MERKALYAVIAAALMVVVVALMRASQLRSTPEEAAPAPLESAPAPARPKEPTLEAARHREVQGVESVEAPRAASTSASNEFASPDDDWFVATEAGVLEVQVLDGSQPARAALVELLGRANGGFEFGEPQDLEHVQTQSTDELGMVRWSGLETDTYDFRATLARGARAIRFAEISKDAPSMRAVVRFGSASIEGTVHGENGEPLPGAWVWMTQTPKPFGSDVQRWTRSEDDGSYRFDGLAAGFTLIVDRSEGSGMAAAGRSARLELADGEHRRVDFGAAHGAITWRGRVRLPSGAATGQTLHVRIDEVERGWNKDLRTELDGRFSAEVLPGTYVARLRGYSGDIELARVDTGAHDLDQDLIVPAPCLVLELRRADAPSDEAFSDSNVSVVLQPRDAPEASARSFSCDSQLFVAGVPPGKYVLSVPAHDLVGYGDEGAVIDMDGTKELVTLSLTVKPRAR